jgi:hypothetical protein
MKYLRLSILAFLICALPSMASASCWQWSRTSSANATADGSINWQVGMSPSSVDASGRSMMARSAECRDDLSGFLVTTGTATAYAVTTYQGLASVPNDGQSIAFRVNVANGTAPTLTADGGTTYPIQTSPGVAVASGALSLGGAYRVTFSLSATSWLLQDFYVSTVGPASIATSNLQDEAVTYQKFQNPSTTSLLLGTPSVAQQTISTTANNGSGLIRLTVASTTGYITGNKKTVTGVLGTIEANGTWTITVVDGTHIDLQSSTFTNAYSSGGQIGGFVEEITVGNGLTMNLNVLSAPAFPPAAAYKNLSIKVATTTTVTCAADYITVSDGTNFKTLAFSGTINLGTAGALNTLDTGVIAIDTWYAVWAIAKADGSLPGFLASASFTSPTLPSGYTLAARVGSVQTIHATATLYGTWQFGRRLSYVIGLASTTATVIASSGTQGSVSTPTWVGVPMARFVPPTASVVYGSAFNSGNIVAVAPNNSYGAYNSSTNPPPVVSNGTNVGASAIQFSFVLESGSIYWASSNAGALLIVTGYEDNI